MFQLLLLSFLFIQNSHGQLSVSVECTSGAYLIRVNGCPWLRSARTAIYTEDTWYSSDNGTLPLIAVYSAQGTEMGLTWNETQFVYRLRTDNITARVRQWSTGDFLTFHLDTGGSPLNVGSKALDMDAVRTVFPSFHIEQFDPLEDQRGYFTFQGMMLGSLERMADRWYNWTRRRPFGGMSGGPLVLFDLTTNGQGSSIVLSSFSHFMATSFSSAVNAAILDFGVMGSINVIPPYHSNSMILVYSSKGINEAMKQWGEVMRRAFNRTTKYREEDFTVNYLGYYTDNGAFYYNHTESNTTYASQLSSLATHFRSVSLPVRYMQIDSWWYYRGLGDGVREWTARPEIFPDGLSSVHESLQIPLAAHNRYWSSNTIYASQYAFLIDQLNQKALPVGNDSFWDNLLGEAFRKWGLTLYEQDWMNHQTIDFQPTRTDLDVGRRWLVSMGKGAHSNGVNIQYCMALPRHALQSLEIPRVTQARVSDDYEVHLVHRIPQWNIGVSSMLAHALGLAPFKDVFWSTSKQDSSPYGLRATEPLPDLQILISTLSTGPVASGDRLGQEDVTAIMRCCRTDGLILKPDRPLTPIDLILAEWAKNNGSSQGELYATHSSINTSIFPIVFAMSMRRNYTLTISSLNLPSHQPYLLWSWNNLFTLTNPFSSLHVSSSECNATSFCLWHLSPVWTFDSGQVQYALLGEFNKWVPVSSKRFVSLSTNTKETNITLIGAPSEHIEVAVYHQALEAILILPCSLSSVLGKGILTFTPQSVYCSPSFDTTQ